MRDYITIFCDASFCHQTKAGGWGCYIRYGHSYKITASGAFKNNPESPIIAEMQAIANSIHIALKRCSPAGHVILVTSDCLNGIEAIRAALFPRKKTHSKELREIALTIHAMIPPDCTLELRHVKAHVSADKGDKRNYVNNICDKLAKTAMLARREELSIKNQK